MKRNISMAGILLAGLLAFGCGRNSQLASEKGPDAPGLKTPRDRTPMEIAFGEAEKGKNIDWGPPPEKELYAKKNYFNQPAPNLIVEKWLGKEPSIEGKFVLIDFWATWCGPCLKAIPELNEFADHFSSELVVIGISSESEATVRDLQSPKIEYYSAIDTQGRTKKSVGVSGIPHVMLIDPSGKVCWQGFPFAEGFELSADVIRQRIDRYTGVAAN